MRVIITGGTGLIGTALVDVLAQRGDEVIVLSRDPMQAQRTFRARGLEHVRIVRWDARTADGWGDLLTGESALVNLAGASPAHWHWTQAYRRRILASRLDAGAAIMLAIERYGPPSVLVQASAAGYYGDRGDELLTEASAPGRGFRAEVCRAWEASTLGSPARHCILRTGFVLDAHTGIFPSFVRFAQLCGSRLGSGRQWLPWMHVRDVARAIDFLLREPSLSGPLNLCAPDLVTNRDFVRCLRAVLRRPALFPLAEPLLRVALGELATVVLDSQRMQPQRLADAGFQWDYPRLDDALHHLRLDGF